ncbi:MAG: DNA translocase FtsK 4TM domain-containing protein [Deltaproteobacteria bacterium]|nr:DNA translocase FtsK 4TM domain-containing protein [Deltaproteobacteria bacterium]
MARRDLAREIAGIILMGCGVFLFLCLYSFHPQDPSFNLYQPLSSHVHNLGGLVGAYLSDLLWQVFGCASLLFPLIFFAMGIVFFVNWGTESRGLRLGGFVLLLISLSTLLDLLLGEVKIFSFEGMAGGVLGKVLGALLRKYLSMVGASLLVTLWFISSVMLTTGISLKKGVVELGKLVGNVSRWIVKVKDLRFGKWKKKRDLKSARTKEVSPPPIILSPKGQKEVKPRQELLPFPEPTEGGYHLPSLALLEGTKGGEMTVSEEVLWANSQILEGKLRDYGVEGKVVGVRPGPIVTVYEFEPAPGIKVNRILNLEDDLALALSALSIRIQAPVPGKPVVGIEIPNPVRETVHLRDVVSSELFQGAKSKLTLAIGKDISGNPFMIDLARLPHLLVAGSTGSGKSVSINCMICNILFKATPDDVTFLLIDPKMLELPSYEGIPHLLLPVVTDPKEAAIALRWMVEEMERRYSMMAEKGFRSIDNYNQKVTEEKEPPALDLEEGVTPQKRLPYVVVVIDELADLMIVSGREVEESIIRLAQMARAAGIHLILATQRPSVDVLTGLIKVNFPARISFQVSSKTDSRTILDAHGAEHLLGSGDMLFLPPGSSKLRRIHGAYVSEGEIRRLAEFWRQQGGPRYDKSILRERRERKRAEDEEYDEKYDDAVAFVAQTGQASISLIQRKFRIGYNRAARIIERMEEEGIVGSSDGVKPREVLIHKI